MNRFLETRDITIQYGEKVVLDRISADFPAGSMTAIIGSNGVGKTTYLKAIANMIRTSGRTRLMEDGVGSYNFKEIAYVPQLGSVQTKLTVFEMVLLGLVNNLKWHVTDEQTERVYALLEELNLLAIAQQPFQTLSGGQKQMVSMAQSLISKPKVLLLDEPTSALDLRHQLVVMNLARDYTREQNAVTLFVVHDLMLASRYGQQIMVLHKGKIHAYGNAEEVLTPELVAEVYGVTSHVARTPDGCYTVLPGSPI